MKFTILGASGFIGSHLVQHLQQEGHECLTPARGDPALFGEELGHVIYCIGLTADFRQRPFDTVRAHVCLLADVLEKSRFDSLLYLSSTRVYAGAASGDENAPLMAGDLYNSSKLTGEVLCFASGRQNVRVARLSNVFGGDFYTDNFLSSVIRDALEKKHVALQGSLGSAKDYVGIQDVVNILPEIALSGRQSLYNVACGDNVSNGLLLEMLAQFTGCTYSAANEAGVTLFPPIHIGRLVQEFDFCPASVLDEMEKLIQQFQKANHDQQRKN